MEVYYAFVSRVNGNDDYEGLYAALTPHVRYNQSLLLNANGAVDYRKDGGIAVIKGSAIPTLREIRGGWNNENELQDKSVELLEVLTKIAGLFGERNAEDSEVVIAIHWGELNPNQSLELDSKLHKKMGPISNGIYFTYFTSQGEDLHYTSLTTPGDNADLKLKETLEYYHNRAIGHKKGIFELYEEILIQAYPYVLENKTTEAYEAVDELVSKLCALLKEAGIADEKRTAIKSLFSKSKYDLTAFRAKVQQILKELPGQIY